MDRARRTGLPVAAGPPVVVEVHASTPAGDAAVGWAAREAARRGVALRVVLPADRAPLPRRRRALARAVVQARSAAPRLVVSWYQAPDAPLRAERTASSEASVLVIAGPSPDADDLITTAYCPVVVVPAGISTDRHGRVLLAAGPATEPDVIGFAFRAAAGRHTGLLAVRTWSDPVPGRSAPDPLAPADDRERRDLAEQLSAFVVAHPDVPVQTRVADDRCADLLTALAHRACLLVLGRSARGIVLGRARPSPALTLTRRLPCPVAVVPPPGPPRRTWLPTRPVRRADLNR